MGKGAIAQLPKERAALPRSPTPSHCKKPSRGLTMEVEIQLCLQHRCGIAFRQRFLRQQFTASLRVRECGRRRNSTLSLSASYQRSPSVQNHPRRRLTVFLTVNSRCQVNSRLPRLIPILLHVFSRLAISRSCSGTAEKRLRGGKCNCLAGVSALDRSLYRYQEHSRGRLYTNRGRWLNPYSS